MPIISSKYSYASLAVMLMGLVTASHAVSVFRMTLTVNTAYFCHSKNQTSFVMKKIMLPLRYGNIVGTLYHKL